MGVIRDAARQPISLLLPGGPGQRWVSRVSPWLACRLYCFSNDSVRFCCERCAPR